MSPRMHSQSTQVVGSVELAAQDDPLLRLGVNAEERHLRPRFAPLVPGVVPQHPTAERPQGLRDVPISRMRHGRPGLATLDVRFGGFGIDTLWRDGRHWRYLRW